ncbi:hypothetical protein JCM21714_277 [Gracilibacillus boraciitolerans JCM 21714]|uniref:Uncharacterized protein n=1 Tax=Gracilibacillus boraciitolerans JCM 21714 TaxID=1298598 RepID=W4VEZ1_9BACI|nr:hypothetical protein [Gracilibacillus boraciitolerans]GAE91329.1 hypothetical protein JCM21714_277 [Gracilibacillus boraciitolerans JCM 21714]
MRARFNNTFDVIASGSNISNFEWILAYMFQPLDISEISFENNHSIAEELGAIENPYSLLETKQTPYKLYQADNTGSSEWLVPITNNQYKTLNSALEEMKNNEQTFLVWATIPNDANIAVENLAENHVFVSISSKQIGDNQLTVSMVESILATAYTYGFQQVTLDIGLDQIGKYDLTAPIDTTNQINIVDLNEAAS